MVDCISFCAGSGNPDFNMESLNRCAASGVLPVDGRIPLFFARPIEARESTVKGLRQGSRVCSGMQLNPPDDPRRNSRKEFDPLEKDHQAGISKP